MLPFTIINLILSGTYIISTGIGLGWSIVSTSYCIAKFTFQLFTGPPDESTDILP